MSEDTLNPNFEWKKKGFEKKERLSRRVDTMQATLIEEKKKDQITTPLSMTANNTTFSAHLKKMRTKIKNALDEDDEDDESNFIFDTSLSSLMEQQTLDDQLFQSLNDTEKKIIRQRHTLNNIKMLQDVAKMSALSKVNQLAQKNNLPQLSPAEIAQNMQNNGWGKETFEMALEHNVAPDIKIGLAKLDEQKAKDLMRGLKRLERIGGFSSVRGMKINDVIKITSAKYDDSKVAKLLLKKTGRKPDLAESRKIIRERKKQKYPSKISFKKLLQQKQEKQAMKI